MKECQFDSGALRRTGIIGVLIVLFFALYCGSGKKPHEITIAVIPMGTTHEFWKSIHAGAVTAAREIGGVRIIWKGPLREDDRDEQVRIIEDFTATRVSAILLSPMDDRTFIRPVMEAKRAGIPTVLVNSSLQGNSHISFVATDNYRGGVIAAEHMGKITGGKGKLIIIRLNEADVTTIERVRGFRETVVSKFPGLEIISENQYAGATTESAFRTGENLFIRYPETTALFTPNDPPPSGSCGCSRTAGSQGRYSSSDSTPRRSSSRRSESARSTAS